MALKLRRGTNTQRAGITFAEGELVYTTDTKKLYIGDGSAAGGNLVSGMNNVVEDVTPQLGGNLDLNGNDVVGTGNINISGSLTIGSGFLSVDTKGSVFANDSGLLVDGINGKLVLANNLLSDIGNVDTASPSNGNVLAWNSGTSKWTPTDYDLTAQPINELSDVNAGSPQDKQALVWDSATSQWIAGDVVQQGEFLDGDFRGSLFGDDSSPIVDATINKGTFAALTATTFEAPQITATTIYTQDFVLQDAVASSLNIERKDDTIQFAGSTERNGSIEFNSVSLLDSGTIYSSIIIAAQDKLMFGHGYNNNSVGSDFLTIESGKLHIGSNLKPTERLEVEGNTKITGFTQFGSYTTVERDDLTTTNSPQYATNFGMVIYNVDVDKFQGWANVNGTTPTWVNLS